MQNKDKDNPKVQNFLDHFLEQKKDCQGIREMLKDDLKHIHQMTARIEVGTSRMKRKAQQAFVHSKIQAIQNSQEIKVKLASSLEHTERKFKKRNSELNTVLRNTMLKMEWDCSILETYNYCRKRQIHRHLLHINSAKYMLL